MLSTKLRDILTSRSFTPAQIKKILPTLGRSYAQKPEHLAEIIDCWNLLMGRASLRNVDFADTQRIPSVAAPSPGSMRTRLAKVDMNSILADVEPQLLQFHPDKLIRRHEQIRDLGIIKTMNEHWVVLMNSPRGFYLQDWTDLSKKVMYITNKLLEFLYTKKEMKEMQIHPLVKSAACVERDYDHIRTRYLFATRVGFNELSHMYKIQNENSRPDLKDLVLSDNPLFLHKFAPYCSTEEYDCFSDLIKQVGIRDDDADIYDEMAELQMLKYESWPKKLSKKDVREAIERSKERKEAEMH